MPEFPRLAALAVLLDADRVLLVRRRNDPDAGLWGYPGGHVDPGEPVADAAVRELLEETGVTAHPWRAVDAVDVIRTGPEGQLAFHFVLVAILCDHVAGRPLPASDVSEAAWHPVSDVLEGRLEMSADVDRVLRHAIAERERRHLHPA